ncbi:MAG: TonB-dependent receptor [Abyssibacter sp.]|uniref:TonB-dependent receptor family protein n=1 Tax=Abyssibacter sp. TaxID=2320200 RepID=UPI00321C1E23
MSRSRLLWMLAFCAPASAQTLQLDPLIVEGEREPPAAAVTTQDHHPRETAAGLSLADWLDAVPGVYAQNRYNLAQGLRPAIRGFGARAAFGVRGIQVLVDGVPLTLPDGQTELDVLDLDRVARVDVVRGPAAALFGNAAGGVIAIETQPIAATARHEAHYSAGELGLTRWRLASGGPWTETFASAFQLGEQRLTGHRNHTSSRVRRLNLQSESEASFGRLQLRGSVLDVEAQDPGALTRTQANADPEQAAARNLAFDAGERIRQQRLQLRWQADTASDRETSVQLYLGQRLFENRLPFESGGQVVFDRHFGGLGATQQRSIRDWTLTSGVDLQHQQDDRRRYDNLSGARGDLALDQREQATGAGLYLSAQRNLGEHWSLALGLRADYLRIAVDDHFGADGDDSGDRRFDDLSWSLQLDRRLGHGLRLHARVASAYESPTAGELANPQGGGFDPSLRAADAHAVETGLTGRLDNHRFGLVLFATRIDDELVPYEIAGQPGRSFYRNSGESQRRGVELDWTWALSAQWSLQTSYTASDFHFVRYRRDGEDFGGKRQPGTPRQQGHVALRWDLPDKGASLRLHGVDSLYADDANSVRAPGYARIDLGGWWTPAPHWRLQAGLNNLSDVAYMDNTRINAFGGRYFEPAPGRHAYAELSVSF